MSSTAYVRIPPLAPEWTKGETAWRDTWRRIRRELTPFPLKHPVLYYASEREEVWVWGRGADGEGAMLYPVWLFAHDEALQAEDLSPMPGKPTRLWNSRLGVWIDLSRMDVLHVGGKPHAKNPAHLKGRLLLGLQLPPMDF